jgi:uncharacterized protein YggU (UPF0235/DUF167 family)
MLRIHVAAHPAARRERVVLLDDGALGVWVLARPVDGQANRAIEVAIARALGLRPRQVRLVAGASSRRKVVEVDELSLQALRGRLLAHGVHLDSDSDLD